MTMPDTPIVLVIDDEEASAAATKRLLGDAVRSLVRLPGEVEDSDLKDANVVLVDFLLDEDWPDRDQQASPSLRPQNGIALAAVLRSNLDRLQAAPVAFALNSGMLTQLSGGRTVDSREHAIARSVDMDWVFQKGGSEQFATSVCSLARAVSDLPSSWPDLPNSATVLRKLIGLDSLSGWRHRAWDEVEATRPPHDILAKTSKGMAVLRWLLHEILPYPTFLVDHRYLAARLRIEPDSMRAALSGADGRVIRAELKEYEYGGVLHDFQDLRWWRAGIEDWLWKVTSGLTYDSAAIENAVKNRLSENLEISQLKNPVLAVDDQFRPVDRLIEMDAAVRVNPDGWPSFSDAAWLPIDEVKADPALAALVSQADLDQLK